MKEVASRHKAYLRPAATVHGPIDRLTAAAVVLYEGVARSLPAGGTGFPRAGERCFLKESAVQAACQGR